MGNNNNGGNGGNGENPEGGIEKQNLDINSALEFRKLFISDSLKGKNQTEKNDFISELMKGNSISPVIQKELDEYHARNQERFPDINTKEIKIEQLRNLVARDFLKIENAKRDLKEKILLNYEIDDKDYDSKVKEKFNSLNVFELRDLLKSDIELENFLNKKNDFTLDKRNRFKFFNFINKNKEDIKEEDIKERLKKVDKRYRSDIKKIFEKLAVKGILNNSDLRLLFFTNFLNPKEEKELVSIFIPFITLKKAVEIGLLTNEEAKNKLKEINRKILEDAGINDVLIEDLSSKLSLEDIKIETKDIIDSEKINQIATDIGFKNLEDILKNEYKKDIEKIKKNGPKNLKELVSQLNEINKGGIRFNNLEKFIEGNIIQFISKDSKGKEFKSFMRILKDNENEKGFSFIGIGTDKGEIDLKYTGKIDNSSYADFLNSFKEGEVKLNCFTQEEIKQQISSKELTSCSIDLLGIDDLNDLEKKEQAKTKYKEYLEEEIDLLKKELENKGGITGLDGKEINSRLTGIINSKNEELADLDNISNESLVSYNNYISLISKLDDSDSEGASIISEAGEKGLFKGMFLKTSDGGIYEIGGIEKDLGIINLKYIGANGETIIEDLDFFGFYEAFKQKKAKRLKPFNDFGKLIESKKDVKEWGDHEFKDGKIIAKNVDDGNDKGVDREVEYLVSSKDDTIIRINHLSGNLIEIQFGEKIDNNSLDEKEMKKRGLKKNALKKYEGETLFIEGAQKYTISLNQLDEYIKKYNLHPDWQTGKDIKHPTLEQKNEGIHGSFTSKLFSLSSISEVLAGGKMFFNSIEETFKKGNELHSARTALLMGKLLPPELRQELQIKVERAESEAMEKEIEGLGKVDSPIAVKRIKSWLLNKNCPEHKKEAGLLFMLEKYGHLTSKEGLYEFRGKFLWYEAFGGMIGDTFYRDMEEDAKKRGITFSEEYLMHIFLKKQCSELFSGHKRRSRLHKEYEFKWADGIEKEFEKGYKDASGKRTADSMVDGGIEEALGGTTSNALGWFKRAIERGGSLETMSEGFFCLLHSGAVYDLDQKTFVRIKGLFSEGIPIMLMRFCTTVNDMNLFNKTVLELSKRMQVAYGGNIAQEAQELYDSSQNRKLPEKDRMIKSRKFWEKYGIKLSRALNMANTDDTSTAKTDNIIFLEKDTNHTFKKYYETLNAFVDENDFKSSFMDEECGEVGITGTGINKLTRQYLKVNTTGQLTSEKTGVRIWKEFYKDLTSINKKTFYFGSDDSDGTKDRELKRKYLLFFLKELCSGFMSIAIDRALLSYNNKGSDIGQFLNSIGLNLYHDLSTTWSSSQVKDTELADSILLKAVDKILAGDFNLQTSSDRYINPLEALQNQKKGKTETILLGGGGMDPFDL